MAVSRKLELDAIADLRAYEREREEFRRRIIVLKKERRVAVGPFVTLVFENRDTIRFQIQEMARVERLSTDAAIEAELAIYNPLIPESGELRATLFVELTSPDELQWWLPQLVGIERAVELRIGDDAIPAAPDPGHAQQLSREAITASVHYVGWTLSPDEVRRFAEGPVRLALAHLNYADEVELSGDTRRSLLGDLRP